jgi:hypothetical protein
MEESEAPLLRDDLDTGFFEELDTSSVPWTGLGRFRFQAKNRRTVGERVFSRDEIEAFADAAEQEPQEMRIEGDDRRWWMYEGKWYITRATLSSADVAAWVPERYMQQFRDWNVLPPDPPPAGAPPREHSGPYLSACAIFLNEGPYLAEWLEFHILIGVERFFMYDNGSTDSSREVLAPYVEEGIVTVHDWPQRPGQHGAYDDCAQRHRLDSRWIAFFDIDEYLFSPTERPVQAVLRDFEAWPGVLAGRPAFGSCGREVKPDGLLIESYLLRCNVTRRNRAAKSIIDPTRVERVLSGHHWQHTESYAVDDRKRPTTVAGTLTPSFSQLRVNHYPTRSREEFARKLATPYVDTGKLRTETTFESNNRALNDITDLAAASYAPAVKEALERRGRKLTPAR